jgi:serine/threonine protein kinase
MDLSTLHFKHRKLYDDINMSYIKQQYKLIKNIKNNKVYYLENSKKKRILKYNPITNRFLNEIYINLEINSNNFIPSIKKFGLLKINKKNYLYYITDFIEGIHIKDLYSSSFIKDSRKLKKLFISFCKKYIKLNKKYGLHHMDIKSDNIIFDLNKKSLKLIDFGSAYTTKYPYSIKTNILKKKLEIPLTLYIYPFKNKNKTSFNYTYKDFVFYQNNAYKSLKSLDTSNIDIINIIKLYNTGERMLFNNKKQIIIKSTDTSLLNSDIEFHKKLKYCIGLINKH